MDQLKQMLLEKANLSEEQADRALNVFTDYLSNMSDDQVKSLVQQVPGLGQHADKLPGGLGKKLGGFLG